MSPGTLERMSSVRADVSENISPLFSGFLSVIGFHGCLTVELLLISFSIAGYYLWSKNAVFWDVITAILMIDIFWNFAPCCSGYNRRFGENIASMFTLKNPEDGGDMFSEISVLTRLPRCKFPEDIYQHRRYISEDTVLRPYNQSYCWSLHCCMGL
jgi:hypothetical protein